MKNSVLFLILIIGLIILGFLVEKKNGAVTSFLGQYEIFDFIKKDSNTVSSENIQNSATGEEYFRISFTNLPAGFKSGSFRQKPSFAVPFETETTIVNKSEGNREEGVLIINQYFSKSDFDQALSSSLDKNSRSIDEDNIIEYSLVRNFQIDGNDATHHLVSIFFEDGERMSDYNLISIPSKLTIINYEYNPDFYDYLIYTLEEINNIISLIRFGSDESDKLITEKDSFESGERVIKTDTKEFFGISINLPENVTIAPAPSQDGVSPDMVAIKFGDLGHLVIEKYKSKELFDKNSTIIKETPDSKTESPDFKFSPVYQSIIDGQQATHYDVNFNGVNFNQLTIPSKFVTVSFADYGINQSYLEYKTQDIKNIISSIKFNY